VALKNVSKIAPGVIARPTPPNSPRRVNPSSRFGVGLKLSFSPCSKGRAGNSFPDSFPTNASAFSGPNQLKIHGKVIGMMRAARNMYIGSALSLTVRAPP
jgi:hypothetical protein